jgi:hypothetical protein
VEEKHEKGPIFRCLYYCKILIHPQAYATVEGSSMGSTSAVYRGHVEFFYCQGGEYPILFHWSGGDDVNGLFLVLIERTRTIAFDDKFVLVLRLSDSIMKSIFKLKSLEQVQT